MNATQTPADGGPFYALRYIDGLDIRDRKHAPTVGRWSDADDAEAARQAAPLPHLLEVVVRGGCSQCDETEPHTHIPDELPYGELQEVPC